MTAPNVNHTFFKGKTHKVCQDYAISGQNDFSTVDQEINLYGIIADGCSSSPFTDIGARLIVHETKKALLNLLHLGSDLRSNQIEIQLILTASATSALYKAKDLQLPEEVIDTTVGFIYQTVAGNVVACLHGDGVLAFKDRGKDEIYIYSITYSQNYPAYVSYLLNPSRRESFESTTDNNKEILAIKINSAGELISINSDCPDDRYVEIYEFDKDGTEWVALMSDGVSSFYRTENGKTVSIPCEKVLSKLLDFKNFNGEFVERRMNAFRKLAQEQQWEHHDDVSLAVIYTGSEQGE